MGGLFTIAPHAPFLETLAERMLSGALFPDWQRTGPFWLADMTVVLPTRRARQALAEIFARNGAVLLPDMRTFGGEAADEEPFLPPFDAPVPPPAASRLERTMALSRLIAKWSETPAGREAFATPPNAAEMLAMAESLGDLIDDLETEGCTADSLSAIVPDELAENWQQTLRFLEIALSYWPEELKGRGKADSVSLRTMRLDRQAEAARLVYGDRPVIAAGSTGSIPATARLLGAIHALPRGAVVLPGLDTDLTATAHQQLIDGATASHGHAQYGLARLLRRLGAGIGDVRELAEEPAARTKLLRQALAPAEATAHWADNRFGKRRLAEATNGLSILCARTLDEEARAIALAARQGLVETKTVGIVTPDRNLARRIAAELARFGVFVDDAAGQPLFQSPAGRMLREILAVAANDYAPIDLMALLRNPALSIDGEARLSGRVVSNIEYGLLRGQRPGPGVQGLRQVLKDNVSRRTTHPARRLDESAAPAIEAVLKGLEEALRPVAELLAMPFIDAASLAVALSSAFDALVSPTAVPDGTEEYHRWCEETIRHGGDGMRFRPRGLDEVLGVLMRGFEVRNSAPRRTDIAIWGQLEARLQSPDLVIVAALNEDVWPEVADPGPWLSRAMRIAAGLEPPERRIGLAAHDFEMALGNREVILAFAERLGTGPAVPSRFVQRLEAFVGKDCTAMLRQRGAVWCRDARRLDGSPGSRRARRPEPNPPVAVRPRQLSVTEIETLFRSPYDIYARHVLGLKEYDRLGDDPSGRERGTLIHNVLGDFIAAGHDIAAPDALDRLKAMSIEAFAGLDAIADRRQIWLRRFGRAAEKFLIFERERDAQIERRLAELKGRWELPLPEPFVLTGRADRIDVRRDGLIEILDFKTGSLPTPREMREFEAPQMLLEAAMVASGAIESVEPASAGVLTYVKIGFDPQAFRPTPFALAPGRDLDTMVEEASRRTQMLIEALLFHQRPLISQLYPKPTQRFAGAYDHLARVAEWSLAEGDESV
ncbi:double-strand break repair protein AddB [Devosia pacifica]|uniref:Double-strand break repair protein AddB n=1 Tax=Devosia pacifica TaxID=1335967 RepID=A0A918S3K2_9HYPH|nr:double-strand break repair protein AddB [Devosia pacifica]GHA21163.1 double-strand break repair protein AddB [Devosia pacifica]